MKTSEIRRRFLAHFEADGHTVVPSAPLPFDDPNLLFVNAGMVQFVPYFIGQLNAPWQRATSVQKCIRTQDIEEVGKTTRHGTFFQMNGNFSFGDYFKEHAIKMAWDLSTKSISDGGFGLDAERIWATVYLDDEEAVDIWHRVVGLPHERIVRRGKADNYWSMGIPGPCGPCSELYYDRGADYGRPGGPEVDEDRFMEFWNLVFMQNERGAGTTKDDYPILGELPAKNIDTGMGLERMSTLLQGVDNLYEIDETRPILNRAAELTGKQYGLHSGHAATESAPDDVRLRVVADHIRTALMLVGDGVTPDNEGRGYVLRRILRRAVRAMRLLGYDDPALPELLPVARDCMSASYPELASEYDRIAMIAYAEEAAFRRTLVAGTTILDTAVTKAKAAGAESLQGEQAFALHDTYGFPIDLTLEMAAEQGLAVDTEGFARLMQEQRARSKADARGKKSAHADSPAYRDLRERGVTEFTGYGELITESHVRGLVRDGESVPTAGAGEIVEVVLERTPFYAESGGQIADEGVITADDTRLRVLDVQRPVKGLIVHRVQVEEGELHAGQRVVASVDPEWRRSARQAHSGTHVVHAALRQVLGPSALQSGSYNKPGYLRLDFAWNAGLDAATRAQIEDVSNIALREDLPVDVRHMTLAQARELGALALFGETYDETVRVVDIGGAWSRELCGGTHVEHSSQVGALTIVGEASIGAGVRRLEAYVGLEALRYLATERALVTALTENLKVPAAELPERVEALVTRLRAAEKELDRLRAAAVLESAGELAAQSSDIAGTRFVAAQAPKGVTGNDLRSLALDVRARLGASPAAVLLTSEKDDGGVSFVAAVNEAGRSAGLAAGELVKVFAPVIGARGGGKPDLAQGAGGEVAKVEDGFASVRASLAGTPG
ncbi:alanyl-tRNA synthetase [Jatrophihabitans sp. GAS493]|uniref:alanine--tRNA ligase n=1 Tax=Jatrophihabitans sp. GAS493 TaxID=1907575 RepID=UPI000BB6E80E|nr:alanine--tRNA ligase [Jatrophihabitans sp. GAS493]SOD74249.1 alanyl-tRNA synthetase [Jatrophihabitans sp. GAS493]